LLPQWSAAAEDANLEETEPAEPAADSEETNEE
jgi:hypothetical protein